MEIEIDENKMRIIRKRIMDLERENAFTKEFTSTRMQDKILDIIEEVALDDN